MSLSNGQVMVATCKTQPCITSNNLAMANTLDTVGRRSINSSINSTRMGNSNSNSSSTDTDKNRANGTMVRRAGID